MAHGQGAVRLAVKRAGHKGDEVARHQFTHEDHPAPPFPSHLTPHVEAEVHLLKVPVMREGKAQHARVEKTKSDHAYESLAVVEIQFRAARHEWAQHRRINRVVQHRELTPLGGEEGFGPLDRGRCEWGIGLHSQYM